METAHPAVSPITACYRFEASISFFSIASSANDCLDVLIRPLRRKVAVTAQDEAPISPNASHMGGYMKLRPTGPP